MKALLLVDLQNDFFPGGALGVAEADKILPAVNALLALPFDCIVATKDWHPATHGSFAVNHAGRNVGEHINLGGIDQILWPTHCVQETHGAEFAPFWDSSKVEKITYKGTDPLIDSYSAFYDNEHRQSTHLEDYLRERGVEQIFIAGLATDYCVKYTVFDALSLGFQPIVVVDACRGVNLREGDSERALAEMQQRGAHLILSKDVKCFV